jgi:1-acyl-sn-glycerol-3-phosphate acyltransferase
LPSLLGRAEVVGRGIACVLAAVPSTILVPLPITRALTRRYHRERLLQQLHFMVAWARFCRKHLLQIELTVEGRERLRSPSRGHMFVSNHQSWVDILVLIEALEMVAFLSKHLVRHIPLIGASAYAAGSVFVRRGDPASRLQALRETIRMCEESTAVLVFPEGTRSPDGELRETIYPASLKAAHARGIKLVPVGLDGTRGVVPKTMDRVVLGQRVAVSVGAIVDPADYPEVDAFVEAGWAGVKAEFARVRAVVGRSGPGAVSGW